MIVYTAFTFTTASFKKKNKKLINSCFGDVTVVEAMDLQDSLDLLSAFNITREPLLLDEFEFSALDNRKKKL